MSLPRLPLRPWPEPPPSAASFPGDTPVLWLEGAAGVAEPFVAELRRGLEQQGRLWSPALRTVPLPGPRPGRNPWAVRQDRQAPLRWGPGDGDQGHGDLAELASSAPLDGCVLVGACFGRNDQQLRTLLRQVVGLLRPHAPWLAVEPNGRAWATVARSLRAPEEGRGEGAGTVRAIEELRRLWETGGFGLEGAWSLPPTGRRARLARRLLGEDGASSWLIARGRAIR